MVNEGEKYDEWAGDGAKSTTILGYELRLTCQSHPEQYDAYFNGELTGYFRMRHGGFSVDAFKCGGPRVYFATPKGDGAFKDCEREIQLTKGVIALHDYIETINTYKRHFGSVQPALSLAQAKGEG